MPLAVTARRLGDVIILTCSGRIVLGPEVKSLQDHITEVVPESPRHIVLQLRDVVFMDSSGMGALVRMMSMLKSKGIKLSLCALPPLIDKALSVTNLLKLFGVYSTEEDAVKAAYGIGAQPGSAAQGDAIVCIGDTADLRAYLGAVIRASGYQPLTCSSLYDAKILISASKPKLIVLGSPAVSGLPNLLDELKATALPILTLDENFSTLEAGAAGEKLTAKIKELLQAGVTRSAQA